VSRDLSPREAKQRFLSRRQQRQADATVRSYNHRLDHFVEWCEANGIESMSEVGGWEIDEYRHNREAADLAPITLKGQLVALRQLLQFCEKVDVIEEGTADKVELPTLTKDQETSDARLSTERAEEHLRFFRESTRYEGTVHHAFLEVAWHTAARVGGIQSLDLGDYDPDRGTLEFRHRPKAGTTLKNKSEGERIVGINADVVDALDRYIARDRPRKSDDQGRQPLFATNQGRPSDTTVRHWSYWSTEPCLLKDCPHSRRRQTCEYTERNHTSKCPSSRSPHAIRTGAITWLLDRTSGDIEFVARRVNATPDTIRRYYDKATAEQEFEHRQQKYQNDLVIGNE
jgi:site-specific recombinase XerD